MLARASVLGILGVVSILAAATDTTGATVATLIAQLGLSGVFLWQKTQSDRRADNVTERLFTVLERQTPVLADTLKALERLERSMAATVERR